jgi:hypothetical protein
MIKGPEAATRFNLNTAKTNFAGEHNDKNQTFF